MMFDTKLISSSIIAGAIAFSVTACGGGETTTASDGGLLYSPPFR